ATARPGLSLFTQAAWNGNLGAPRGYDALVWALTELLLGRVRRPGVRRL
ncbi:MAG: hypothetical protein JO290_14090, partial [Sphingomonadaceae bacterium]|nr:hypothetical protein [Sphingomonadaceae bacterium]